ncbi:hypothetical protein ACHQM5_012193 [Ranunculus cassubicifolius]
MRNNFQAQITKVSNITSSNTRNLYICFSKSINEVDNVVWYKINPSYSTGSDDQIPSISSVCSIPVSQVGYGFRPAFIGSKIYMIGGSRDIDSHGSKDVYCVDTQCDDESLVPRKLHIDTLANRQGSATVSTHGKIYVFGSVYWKKTEPWAEVFDPSMNQWFPLPDPPNELHQACQTIFHVVVGDTILLSYDETLASFDVKTNSWCLLSTPLTDSPFWNFGATTLDDLLFMFHSCSVIAYDVVTNKWFKEPVRGLELEYMSFLSPIALIHGYVVHLGDKNLCVIWYDEFEGGDEEFCVRCVKFRVSTIYDAEIEEEVLQAEVQARSAYRMRSGGDFLVDCFPI